MNKRITGNTIGKYLIRNTIAEYLGNKPVFKNQEDFNRYYALIENEKQLNEFKKYRKVLEILVDMINTMRVFQPTVMILPIEKIDYYEKMTNLLRAKRTNSKTKEYELYANGFFIKNNISDEELEMLKKCGDYFLEDFNANDFIDRLKLVIDTTNSLLHTNTKYNNVLLLMAKVFKIKEIELLTNKVDKIILRKFEVVIQSLSDELRFWCDKQTYQKIIAPHIFYDTKYSEESKKEVEDILKSINETTENTPSDIFAEMHNTLKTKRYKGWIKKNKLLKPL